MTDERIAVTPGLLADIEDLLTVSISDPYLPWTTGESIDVEITGVLEDVHHGIAERREYEIRGAWRAGYRYVHVYRPSHWDGVPLARRELSEVASVPLDYLEPSDDPTPRGGPGRYAYTYDLDSVPDDVLRAAIRGEISPGEWDA